MLVSKILVISGAAIRVIFQNSVTYVAIYIENLNYICIYIQAVTKQACSCTVLNYLKVVKMTLFSLHRILCTYLRWLDCLKAMFYKLNN